MAANWNTIHDYDDGGDDNYQDNLKFDLIINEIFRNCVRLFKFLFVHIPYVNAIIAMVPRNR